MTNKHSLIREINFPKLFSFLNPAPKIGGLEIDELDIRYALIQGKNVLTASLRLSPEIIEKGVIKDTESFRKSLLSLHDRITRRKKEKIPVILNIPDINVYTQVFNLPFVAVANLNEAVKLNLQIISPIDYASVYSDWQKVGESEVDGGQLEILGAFAPRNIIDEYTKILGESNFSVVAVEFPGLSLTRALNESSIKDHQFLILLRLSSGGFNFSIIRKRNLYFNHSTLWQAIWQISNVYLKEFEDVLVRETQRVLNFFSSRWQAANADFSLIVPNKVAEERILKTIKSNFSFEIQPFQNLILPDISKLNLSSLSSDWYAVLGSALRGLIPRSKDNIISLSGVGTIERFEQDRVLNFIRFWRNIALVSIGAILILFLGTEIFLRNVTNTLNSRLLETVAVSPESQEIDKLRAEVKKFNEKVDVALQARRQVNDQTPYLERIKSIADDNISIQRIFIQASGISALFLGQATTQEAILKFKDALTQDPEFLDINLPLSGIIPNPNGLVSFTLNFRIKAQ